MRIPRPSIDRAPVGTLAAALVVSGFALDAGGMCVPASGGEHLVSHNLDICARGWRREPRLHGEQVAVGTALSLALSALRALGPPDSTAHTPLDEDDDTVRRLHAHREAEALTELAQQAAAKPGRHTARYARHVRNRYTVLDLAADLGVAADEVISW